MTDPDAVARALARLASGDARARGSEPYSPVSGAVPATDAEPARVVADAEASMQRLARAAAFVDADGEEQLRGAVERADRTGDDALAERGRDVLETLAAFRAAADATDADESRTISDPAASAPNEGRTTSTPLAQRSSGEGP